MSFKDITSQQNRGFGSVSSFAISDNSPLGVAKNTVAGLPKAALKVGGDILQSIARSFGSAGLTLMGKEEITPPEDEFGKKVFNFVYGGKGPVQSLQKRIVVNENKIRESGFAKKYGIDKYATQLAFAGVMGSVGLDLTPFGGVQKSAVKALAKETSEAGVVKILQNMKVSDDIIKEFAPKVAQTTSEAEVKSALEIIQNAGGIKKLSQPAAKPLAQEVKAVDALTKKEMVEVIDYLRTGKEVPQIEDTLSKLSQKYGINQDLSNNKMADTFQDLVEKTKTTGDVRPVIKSKEEIVSGFSKTAGQENIQKVLPEELPRLSPQSQKELSSIDKITQALKEVKPLRGEQEKLFTQERGLRLEEALKVGTRGEAGYAEQLGKLKGGMAKIDYTPLRDSLKQADIDNLFTHIQDSADLSFWDSVTARNGLVKILDGRLPTEGEIGHLSKVFPKDFVDAVLSNRSLWDKTKNAAVQMANLPRAVMSSFDLSAPFRQGLFLVNKPKRFFGAFKDMVRSFGSERVFNELQRGIKSKTTYKLMLENKLALTDMGTTLATREERFMSGWAEGIPLVGRGVKASGRAYTAFLNKLRADVFEDLVIKADKLGVLKDKPGVAKELANFINTATGRGSLGALERSAVGLNSFFFSPRLMASRLTLLNPVYYIKATPFVRKEAIKSLLTLAGVATTVLALAKMGGAEVSTEPTSADFGKIKVGNTRVDILGGFQQYIVAATRLATGKYTSTVSGETSKLGEGYKSLSRYDIILRQIEAKEAPIISFITTLAKGKDVTGKPISIPQKTLDIFTPMTIGALIDIAKDDPQLLPLGALGSFGLGVQTYESSGTGFSAGASSSSSTGFGSVTESFNQGFGQ